MADTDETYSTEGSHTFDLPETALLCSISVRAAGGADGQDTDDYQLGDDGASGGRASGELDLSGTSTTTLIANVGGRPTGPIENGGNGGGGSAGAGDGGDAGAASDTQFDDGTRIAIADGGGGGGGGGVIGFDNEMYAGGGGGGGARGGSGGGGGDSDEDNDGGSGGDGEGTGNGGNGGRGGGDNGGADPGSPGGATVLSSWFTGGGSTSTGGGNSGSVGTVSITVTKAAAPANVTASENANGDVVLSWDGADPSETEIYRSTSPGVDTGDTLVESVTDAGESYIDTTVAEGTTYYYRLRYVGTTYDSDLSAEVEIDPSLPSPTDFSIDAIDATTADLTWTLQSTDEDGVKIYGRPSGDSYAELADLPAGTESTTVTGLLNGRDYRLYAAAYTSETESASNTDSAATDLPDVAGLSLTTDLEAE